MSYAPSATYERLHQASPMQLKHLVDMMVDAVHVQGAGYVTSQQNLFAPFQSVFLDGFDGTLEPDAFNYVVVLWVHALTSPIALSVLQAFTRNASIYTLTNIAIHR